MSSAVFLCEERTQNMHDFGFTDIFYPVLAALVSSVVIFESVHFGVTYLMAKRQMKKYLEFQEKIQSGEIELPPEMMGQMAPGMMGQSPFGVYPTASGSGEPIHGSGQYL